MPKRAVFRTVAGFCLAAALASGADIPRPSPDFAINQIEGQPLQPSQFKGKVCVLAFILTTCPHCQKTIGYLSAIQKEYGPRGVQVIASAIEDMAKMNVPDFIKRFQPPFPVGFNTQTEADVYLQHPVIYVLYVPQLVFIDRQGIIRAQHAGEDKAFWEDQDAHIREQIDASLKEGPAAQKKATAAVTPKKAS